MFLDRMKAAAEKTETGTQTGLPRGVATLLKRFGIEPDKLIADATQMGADAIKLLNAVEQRLKVIEDSLLLIHRQLAIVFEDEATEETTKESNGDISNSNGAAAKPGHKPN